MIELPSIQQLENFIIYSKVKDIATAAREANVTRSVFSFQMKKIGRNSWYSISCSRRKYNRTY